MTDTNKSSDPIDIPPPNNQRSSWWGWGNSSSTPNKNNTDNVVSLSDDDKLDSTDSEPQSDAESTTSNNDDFFEEDISKGAVTRKFYNVFKTKNKCEKLHNFIVNAPDILVVWGLLAAGCIFQSPIGYLISMGWYTVEKTKHQQKLNTCISCNKWSDDCYCQNLTEKKETLNKQD